MRFESFKILKRVYLCLKNHSSSIVNALTIKMVFDSRCLGKTKWCGVILRHIPSKSERYKIKEIFQKEYTAHKIESDSKDGDKKTQEEKQFVRILNVAPKIEIKKKFCTVL